MSNPFRRPLTLTRYNPSVYTNGLWVEGTTSTVNLTGSVQPTSPTDMQRLPEGRREQAAFTIFSDTAARVANSEGQHNADTLVINGRTYEVLSVEHWQNAIVPHYKWIVSLVEANA